MGNMNDRQLRSFLCAARTGSFSKAAEESFISTPAFAQQISLLERDLGFKLFSRSSRGVTLTEAGELFKGYATEALRLLDEGADAGRKACSKDQLSLRIAYDPSEAAPFLTEVCKLLRSRRPDINVTLVPVPYSAQIDGVSDGQIDACFFPDTKTIGRLGLEFVPLYEDSFYCCVSESDPLSRMKLVRPEDLSGKVLFIENEYSDDIQLSNLVAYLKEHAIPHSLDRTPFDASMPTTISLNGGVLPVPGRYVVDSCPPLVAVKLDLPPSQFGIVRRKERLEALDGLIDAAREYFTR